MRQVAGPDVACPKNWHQLSWSSENPSPPTTYTVRDAVALAPGQGDSAVAQCDEGDFVTGGGYQNGGHLEIDFNLPTGTSSEPSSDRWSVTARNDRNS